MKSNGVTVLPDERVNLTNAARFILNGVDPQAIEDVRLHLLDEATRIMQENPKQIKASGLLFISAAVTIKTGRHVSEIFAASVLESTGRLDIDARLIISHSAFLGTESEINELANYASNHRTATD